MRPTYDQRLVDDETILPPLSAGRPGLRTYSEDVTIDFDGRVFHWAGPAPHFFVSVPEAQCEELRAASRFVTYGWGMIPVHVRIGAAEWRTSLFPKDGRYLVPLRLSVRRAEGIEEGDEVSVHLDLRT